jgi:hypothetical protein
VQALYQAAGLNLSADLQNLTKHANITPDPAAVSSLEQTSVPTGHLSVPELDLHTIGDNLVPVTMENFYAKQVTEAVRRGLQPRFPDRCHRSQQRTTQPGLSRSRARHHTRPDPAAARPGPTSPRNGNFECDNQPRSARSRR